MTPRLPANVAKKAVAGTTVKTVYKYNHWRRRHRTDDHNVVIIIRRKPLLPVHAQSILQNINTYHIFDVIYTKSEAHKVVPERHQRPEKDRATTTGNMHRKFVEVRMCGSWDARGQTDRQTHTHTHTHTHNRFTALWNLSGTTRVSRYQKKHSPTNTHHGHQSSQSAFSIYYEP